MAPERDTPDARHARRQTPSGSAIALGEFHDTMAPDLRRMAWSLGARQYWRLVALGGSARRRAPADAQRRSCAAGESLAPKPGAIQENARSYSGTRLAMAPA